MGDYDTLLTNALAILTNERTFLSPFSFSNKMSLCLKILRTIKTPYPRPHTTMTRSKQEIIEQCPLFQTLSTPQVQALSHAAQLNMYGQGSVIVREGMPVASMFIVATGIVRVSTVSLDREVELKHLGQGSYFGEVSLLSGKNATATVEAAQDGTEVLAIDKATILNFVDQYPDIKRILEGVTLARAKDTISKVLK